MTTQSSILTIAAQFSKPFTFEELARKAEAQGSSPLQAWRDIEAAISHNQLRRRSDNKLERV